MRVRIQTNTPGFYNDIAEMFRLIWGPDCSVQLCAAAAHGIGGGAQQKRGDAQQKHSASRDAATACVHRSEDDGQSFIQSVYCLMQQDGRLRLLRRRTRAPYAAGNALEHKRYHKRAVKNAFFDALRPVAPDSLPWGSLTGIRPMRLLYEFVERGDSLEQAADRLQRTFYVSPQKARLLQDIHLAQRRHMAAMEAGDLDVYVGIPFCLSRCSYCSFAAQAIDKARKWVQPYLQALKKEIACCGRLARQSGARMRCLYFGGGTPTALSPEQLGDLLESVYLAFGEAFDEVTVEAGRPDTLSQAMIDMLKAKGVGRISVNPQTLHDQTLHRIGRNHTVEDTLQAYRRVRKSANFSVNMDLILGLPGETADMMEQTLRGVMALRPENITVHTLAMKRASKMMEQGKDADCATQEAVAAAVARAERIVPEGGYAPYYLYRQKYMAGQLENVGYTLPGEACLYNIHTMEETTGVMALGAGAISKRIFDRERRIERQPNSRDIAHYILHIEELMEKKREFFR